MKSTKIVLTPIGELQLIAEAGALIALHLPGLVEATATRGDPGAEVACPVLDRAAAQLAEYFAGERQEFDLALAPRGTAFQRAVWDALLAIPFGEHRRYGELAAAIGRPTASRAVGAANGQNPIAIIVPCHRVIGSNGGLTGYAGGLEMKRWLLEHERRYGAHPRPPGGRGAMPQATLDDRSRM